MAASHVAPPDMESLEKARAIRMNEMQMEAILKGLVIHNITRHNDIIIWWNHYSENCYDLCQLTYILNKHIL